MSDPGYTGPERRTNKNLLYDPRLTLGMLIQAGTIAASAIGAIFAAGSYVQHLREEIAHSANVQASVQAETAQTSQKDQALLRQLIQQAQIPVVQNPPAQSGSSNRACR